MRFTRMFVAVVGFLLPSLLVPGLMSGAQAANCEKAISGPGIYQVEEEFSFPTCGAVGTVIRSGTSDVFGLVHIEKRANETNNHETSDFAMEQWQAALNGPVVATPSPGYFVHSAAYSTPMGEARIMCVYVDTKPYEGQGQKGITSAFWITKNVCPNSPS